MKPTSPVNWPSSVNQIVFRDRPNKIFLWRLVNGERIANLNLLSIQVGMPKERGRDHYSDTKWTSGIFKYSVKGRVWIGALNLDGDGQADLDNHGGPYRAALMYAASHYDDWRELIHRPDWPYGAFGENFTVSELTEKTVSLGDIYMIGDATIQVTQSRLPCWKLSRRWEMKHLSAKVQETARGGWYARVLQEGYVEAGNLVALIERPFPDFTIALANDLIYDRRHDADMLTRLSECEVVTPRYRDLFAQLAAERTQASEPR